jgi:UDP-glucose 4-epimerase
VSHAEIRSCPVVVVGGAGFLGSHLVNHLIDDRDCDVTVIDNLCAGRREFVHKKARFVHADITLSEEYLYQVFHEARLRDNSGSLYVFNYAAWPYVPDSYARPSQVCNVNFHGAMNVINAAESAGAVGILQVSSAEVYGDASLYRNAGDWVKIPEDCPVTPHSTYGASKAAIDFYVQCRFREVGTPAIALRQFNCLGERETHLYVVPEIIGQLSKWSYHLGEVKLGNNSSRDFMYAGDAVRLATLLLEKSVQQQKFGEVYNLGSEEAIKVYDLARTVEDYIARGRKWAWEN